MEILNSILKLLAGIGLFLFAMYLLEESVKNLSGRNFKLFLQRVTKNRIGAVSGGALITGVLQSSSMVSLMVLAFLGAGIFNLTNAMAIILGANLGTTLDSWLVATLGFKVNIEVVAYPLVFIAGLLIIILNSHQKIKYISFFLLGFGLLFIGLSFMKTAMEDQVKMFDFSKYGEKPLIIFLLIGFIITLLVQSSSVTMALTLSALHAGAITFPLAAAIVLGSETGTTLKIMLGAVGGNSLKKRVALGNLFFNIFLTVLAFIFLRPTLHLITEVIKIHDPLIGLVTFSTLVNAVTVIIFLPFLGRFAKLLEKFFRHTDASASAFIGHANIKEPETAFDLFKKETEYFIYNSLLFNLTLFEIETELLDMDVDFKRSNENRKFLSKTSKEKYEFLKQLQGELQSFYLDLRTNLPEKQYTQLNQMISASRNSMYSIKCLKDIRDNISNLSRSSKNIKYNFYSHHKKETENLYQQFNALMTGKNKEILESLPEMFSNIQHNYESALNKFYKDAQEAKIEDLDITTVLNFNRELFASNKSMLLAIKDFLLSENEAADLNKIPMENMSM